MLITTSNTSVSRIPSEAMTGPRRLPIDIGIGHYDPPPPGRIENATLGALQDEDRLRFANRLEAWIEVEEDEIVAGGYSGRAVVGSTTARLGVGSMPYPGVGYPLIQDDPETAGGTARLLQTPTSSTETPSPTWPPVIAEKKPEWRWA